MQSNRADPYPVKTAGVGLLLSMHLDAFRASPSAYLTALWWRLRRKRLRSRSQFARLLGTSPRAYDMWMLSEEEAEEIRERILLKLTKKRERDGAEGPEAGDGC